MWQNYTDPDLKYIDSKYNGSVPSSKLNNRNKKIQTFSRDVSMYSLGVGVHPWKHFQNS